MDAGPSAVVGRLAPEEQDFLGNAAGFLTRLRVYDPELDSVSPVPLVLIEAIDGSNSEVRSCNHTFH